MARNNIPADDGLVTDGFNAVDAALDGKVGALVVLKKSTTQSLGSGATTAVTWDVETLDPLGCHGTTNLERITVPAGQAGVWLILASVIIDGGGTSRRDLMLKVNGTTDIGRGLVKGINDASETSHALLGWGVAALAAGDYVSAHVWVESTAVTAQVTSSLTAVRLS